MASAKRERQRERRRLRTIEESAGTREEIRSDLVAIDEATLRSDGTVPICLITPGWGSSGFYSAEVLEAAGDSRIWPAGTQMFADHPTITERSDRPERSIRDLVAVLESDARWDGAGAAGPGLYAQARIFEAWKPTIAELAPHIGVSVRAAAEVSVGEAEGRRGRIVDNIVEGGSVDFVTRAGRGGKVLAILESARGIGEAWSDDVRQALNDQLRNRFPAGDNEPDVWASDLDAENHLVVFRRYGEGAGTFQLGYSIDDDGNVTLADGDPTAVRVTTTYTPIGEARNVGQWVESHIHRHFTVMCDDMAAEGRLTREERIALSSAIGDALGVFVGAVEQTAPQLYQRDLFDEVPTTAVTESEEDLMDKKQIDEAVNAALDARVKPLEEKLDQTTTELAESKPENDKLRTGLVLRDARDHVTKRLAEAKYAPLAPVHAKIVEAVTATPALTDDGALDTAKLDEALAGEIKSWATIIGNATGSPIVDLGESGGGNEVTVEDAEQRLGAAFGRLGLSEAASKTAVEGRVA